MHDAVEKQLEQYVNMGLNDKIRICASDFSTGLVDRLVVDSYLILRPEKLYQAFTGDTCELCEIVILPRYVQLTSTGGDAKSEAGDRVRCGSLMSATNGERGRIDGVGKSILLTFSLRKVRRKL
ncbi:hypothetical protein T08_770 [Trichinella sp. T8]|nr:hypothetical protein T08_770 [Trichinella sp. T8]